MGQYFAVVNLTKKQIISPYDFNNGAKMMEHSWLGNEYVGVVLKLLKPGKDWHNDRIVWSSDYMDSEEFLSEQCKFGEISPANLLFSHYWGAEKNEAHHTLFSYAYENFDRIKPAKKKNYSYKSFKYLVNQTLGQYVNFDNCPFVWDEWDGKKYKSIVNPLPLLTVSGHGRGGGCYYGDAGVEFIGTWAGHRISLEKVQPAGGFIEIKPNFIER